ncbi:hypothetical protein [Arthrobacter cavernae]|uniref:Uncharacterized protein n=1 Tax=Arthrobacter cavernae TaxID=2817681 RepID=A0A939KHY6_9MICC|nr:hypothetical protein [Arthrobacter cavernae]MBO1267087.1 hypothetical protein [Arthrobacter cavernae]
MSVSETQTSKTGLYVHKESGAELVAVSDIQGDAFVHLGYEYKGEYKEAPAAEVEAKKGTK